MTAKSIITNLVCVFILAPILAALIIWGAYVFIPESPAPPPAVDMTPAQAAVIRPAPHTPVSGRTVYMANCAKCHGASGDGKGTELLDRPARSFLEGGFSFGNTTEAVRRVVQHGIAGTPMPGFAGTLNAAQTRAVVKYVLAMAPAAELDVEDALLEVRDRPLVLRGMLPARGPFEEVQPRGLLLGGTDGLTLAYDVDDVRFRVARQGAFARRTDWEGRGGTPIEPLGREIHWSGFGPAFVQDGEPVQARFRGTSIRDGRAELRFSLPQADVREWGAIRSLGILPGYVRTLHIEGNASPYTLQLPTLESPVQVGKGHDFHWWRAGQDLIGVRGATPTKDGAALPANGIVELFVIPGVDVDTARRAGIPEGAGT